MAIDPEVIWATNAGVTNFPERVKQTRKSRGLSQAQLGQKLDVSVMTVSRWERGENEPEQETLERLARVLGKSPVWLRYGVEQAPKSGSAQTPPPEFAAWEKSGLAPDDLTASERKRLASISFDAGEPHPGVLFYVQTLALWRTFGVKPEDVKRGVRLTGELRKSSEAKKSKR